MLQCWLMCVLCLCPCGAEIAAAADVSAFSAEADAKKMAAKKRKVRRGSRLAITHQHNKTGPPFAAAAVCPVYLCFIRHCASIPHVNISRACFWKSSLAFSLTPPYSQQEVQAAAIARLSRPAPRTASSDGNGNGRPKVPCYRMTRCYALNVPNYPVLAPTMHD